VTLNQEATFHVARKCDWTALRAAAENGNVKVYRDFLNHKVF